VRLARHQERFFPLGIRDVDVHGMEAGGAHPRQRGVEVADLEREVMRPVAVAGDEARQEVVAFDFPWFEELDRHAVALVRAEPYLHGPKADRLATEDHAPAELAREKAEGVGRVGGGERDVIKVERQHEGSDVR
jgi:hypothetical protein